MTSPRRNEPCPCGSGRRYKDCHGRLVETGGLMSAEALMRRALEAHERGRLDEAQSLYDQVLEREPGHAVATHYSGMIVWQRGDAVRAEALMRASIERDAGIADFHNNLGLLLRDTGRARDAVDSIRRAIELMPTWVDARNNLGLALEAAGRWGDASAAYREAIAAQPMHAVARQNLARALLTQGDFAAAWPEYRWRLPAQGITRQAPDAAQQPWPASLAGRRIALIAEQGVGDIIFFLRFAAPARARGAALAFRGDARLHTMLARTGLFELGMAADGAGVGDLEPVYLGDLPWRLGANDPASFPPSLALAPEPARLDRMRDRLRALGNGPYVALTWRGGIAGGAGPAITQLKRVDPVLLGKALHGVKATWLSVQRLPHAGEREALEAALGTTVHDLSAVNDDLEEMLALMALVDAYAGTSNANMYLRAPSGRPMHVLVAHPPEWRWGVAARTPWFANARLYRQDAEGRWDEALRGLAAALTSPEGS